MSMHIKSPTGTPDIDIGSVRVKPSTTTKTITANGTYNASSDNVDGYSAVTVNVPSLSAMDKVVFSTDAVPIATWLYYPLSAADIDVTCYGVLAAPHHSYGGDREIILLNIPYSLSNGNDPAFYSPNYSLDLYATVYGNNELISGISVADYHVYTISVNAATKKARFYVDGVFYLEKHLYIAATSFALAAAMLPTAEHLTADDCYANILGLSNLCKVMLISLRNSKSLWKSTELLKGWINMEKRGTDISRYQGNARFCKTQRSGRNPSTLYFGVVSECESDDVVIDSSLEIMSKLNL